MQPIEIAGRMIGPSAPCFIIAEACDNHLGNMATAKEMARQAKLAGADAIKYQHHLPDEEMLRENVPMSANFNMPLYDFLKLYALKLEDHAELMRYCNEIGILYLCTPFSWQAAKELHEIGLQAFKIGSGELTDIPSLKRIAQFGKPMILSTGMCDWNEIDETVNALRPINNRLILMNCTSAYPTPYSDVNLGVVQELTRRYEICVGHSDHTTDIVTCIAAVAMGARLLEKHFILDKRQPGPDQSVSIDAHELYSLVQGVRNVELALGNTKTVHKTEKTIRAWAHRSVVSIAPITKGSVITEDMVWTKRPGTGIPSKRLGEVLGKVAIRDIPKDRLISWDDLEA